MRKHNRKGFDGERFMAIGYPMFEHISFKTLSDKARSIILLFLYRYNGSNNGEIHLTAREIQKWYGYVRVSTDKQDCENQKSWKERKHLTIIKNVLIYTKNMVLL